MIKPKIKSNEISEAEQSQIRKAAFDSMGNLFLLTNEEFKIIDVNNSFCEVTGLSREELINRDALSLDSDLDIEKMRQYQRLAIKGPILFDFRHSQKDGRIMDFEVHYSVTKIRGQNYFASIVREVTKYRTLQRKLTKSNERFEMIADASVEGLWEIYTNTNEKWANETYKNFFGLNRQDTIPSQASWEAHIHPDDKERVINELNEAIRRRDKNFQSEYWFHKGNGEYILIFGRTLLEYDQAGKPIRMLGSMVDVTNLRHAREQLETQKNLSEDIINSLPGVFYLVTKEGKILRWNKNLEILTGYTAGEIKDMVPKQFFPKGAAPIIKKKFEEVFACGKAEMKVTFLSKDGTETPYFLNGWHTNYKGQDCVIGVGIDTSEEKRVRTRIKRMEKDMADQRIREQKTLSRVIIQAQERERNHIGRELHDNVNQLLAGARLYLNMGAKKNTGFSELIRYPIELLDNGIQEIRELTHKNITPSKDMELKQLVEGLMDFLKAASIKHKLIFKLDNSVNEDLRVNIYRILQEQTNNIIKHSKATSATFKIYRDRAHVVINTTDDGVGFDVHEVREGIGLYNMYSRIEAYDGEIEIDSEPGKGCKIRIRIPEAITG